MKSENTKFLRLTMEKCNLFNINDDAGNFFKKYCGVAKVSVMVDLRRALTGTFPRRLADFLKFKKLKS